MTPVKANSCKYCGSPGVIIRHPPTGKYYQRRFCGRCQKLKADYGITTPEYNAILESQGGTCALCDKTDSGRKGQPLFVDHCHETGKIRGLLCRDHNTAIGHLGDNLASLQRVVSYLST
jgi:hypothetical protein